MEYTNDAFKKEKVATFLTVISVAVLCIQHFWGIFASKDKLQIAFIPLIITFATISINEISSSYKNRKRIATTATIGAVILGIAGVSIIATTGYGIPINKNNNLIWVLYIVVTGITFMLDVFEIKKLIEI